MLGERASTPSLWNQVCRDLSGRLCGLWAQGYLQGATRKEGYYVKCDQTTMTQNYIDNGWLICEVGVAPIAPAEFVVFRIKFQLRSLHSCRSVGSEDGQVLIEHRSGQIIKYPLSDINFSVAVMAEKPMMPILMICPPNSYTGAAADPVHRYGSSPQPQRSSSRPHPHNRPRNMTRTPARCESAAGSASGPSARLF